MFLAISPVHASTSTVDWTCQSFELARVGEKTSWKHETWLAKRVVFFGWFWKASHCLAKMRIRGYVDTQIRRYKATKIHRHTVLWARPISVIHALEHTGKPFRLITESYTRHFRLNWVETRLWIAKQIAAKLFPRNNLTTFLRRSWYTPSSIPKIALQSC